MEIYLASGLYKDKGVTRGIVGHLTVDEENGRFAIGKSSSISGLVMQNSETTKLRFINGERMFEVLRGSDLSDLTGKYEGKSIPLDKIGTDSEEHASIELF